MKRNLMSNGVRMRHRQLGMTLIELMIVVAIIGILAAIAYPSYRQYVLRGNRTEAKTALMQAAQALEKCFTRFGAYNNANCTAYNSINGGGQLTEGGRYRVSFANVDDPVMEFRLQATPQGAQATDDSCGTLGVDQTGRRSAGTADVRADVSKCW